METRFKRRAKSLGVPVSDVLNAELVEIAKTGGPSPECLEPFDIENSTFRQLTPEQERHVSECPMCASLLEAAKPPFAWIERAVQMHAPKPARRTRSFMQAVAVGGLGVIVCICVAGGYFLATHDALVFSLALNGAGRLAIQLLLCILLLAGAAAFAARRIETPSMAPVLASVFVVVFAILTASFTMRDYAKITGQLTEMAASEWSLVGKVATVATSGSRMQLVSEEVPNGLPGRLLAKKGDLKTFDVLWDKTIDIDTAVNSQIGTIYQCKIQLDKHEGNVCANPQNAIDIAPQTVGPTLKVGDEVLAFVRKNASSASTVYPLQAAASK
jgi:hypothetical protein